MALKRTNVYIDQAAWQDLQSFAASLSESASLHLRRAIREYLARQTNNDLTKKEPE